MQRRTVLIALLTTLFVTSTLIKVSFDNHHIFKPLYARWTSIENASTHKTDVGAGSVLEPVCGRRLQPTVERKRLMTALTNTLLVVIMNSPMWKLVPLLDDIYRPLFNNIAYCSMYTNSSEERQLQKQGYNIIVYHNPRGQKAGLLFYGCVIATHKAAKRLGSFSGFLFTADDGFFSLQLLASLPQSHIWATKMPAKFDYKSGKVFRGGSWTTNVLWTNWKVGNIEKLFSDLQAKLEFAEEPAASCYRTLMRITGGQFRLLGLATTDMFYFPSDLLPSVARLAQIFFDNRLMVEITIGNIVACLDVPKRIHYTNVTNLWGAGRSNMMNLPVQFAKFTEQNVTDYFHPIKLGRILKNDKSLAKFLCTKVVPWLYGIH